jgi:hypothetical protein
MSNTKEKKKTKDELQQELELEKRNAWENFKHLEYDQLSEEDRRYHAESLYQTMTKRVAPDPLDIPFDFWTDYRDTDEIKDVNRFVKHVDDIIEQIGTMRSIPTRSSWLDKERGIIPNLKKEWKTKLDPFKDERVMKRKLENKAQEIISQIQDKSDIIIDLRSIMKKALENIETTAYQPIRDKIEMIEIEIYKKLGEEPPKRFTPPQKEKKVETNGDNDNI